MTTKAPLPTDLAGVLHDVSNSLTVVLGWAEEASHASASRETIDAALRIIVAEARRGRTLARSAIGGDDAGLSGTIEAVVASVANGCVIEARRRGVTVRVDARAKGAVARALELEHVLLNLALNAAAFASSSVILTAEEVPGGFAVRVTDDGPGISPSRSESIFQGDSTREGGTGIGLAHARSVLRARGGDLTLEPANAGPGACFVATFSAAIPSRAASAQGLDGLRVLVVEDDPAVSVLLETALDTRGAVPTMAPNLKALLAAQGPFDVVLLDLSPIAGNPIQATEHLKTLANPSSWILATGSSANIPKVLANAWMVEKPYEVSEIVAAVQAAAERVRKAT